ncbi:MAG: ABC transporter ATP-binding protein [Desulfomonile sp.]|nr:ABC transporter ATP-binding protein [Desulfomonile sp.]
MAGLCNADVHRASAESSREIRLRIDGISTFYGEAQALKDVSLRVHPREIVAILGSNGAGKSTLLKTVAGLLSPQKGKIVLDGEPIEGRPAHEVIRKGIACVPEGRELFGSLTVRENLELGTYSLPKSMRKKVQSERLEMIFSLFAVLKRRLKQKAETLSGGEQQMLAMGRALMADPKLLATDEPSLGLAPMLVAEMMSTLRHICDEWGVSLLLVEQNARAALKIADYVYVLERGKVVLEGTREEVIASPTIQAAYMGG